MRSHPGGLNVHVYPTPFTHESRILKITETLVIRGVFERVVILATSGAGLAVRECIDERREVWRVGPVQSAGKSGVVWKLRKTLEWSLRSLVALRGIRVECVNCHSLPVLPLCVAVRLWKRCRLVYDTHELETETVAAGRVRRLLSKCLERLLIPFVHEVVVVNHSIASWYENAYGRKAWVVMNIPRMPPAIPAPTGVLRRACGIRQDELLFLYLGSLSKGRGIALWLEAFAGIRDRHVVFLGYGPLADLVGTYSERCPNIHLQPAVAPELVGEYAADADVGLSLIENVCLSYYLSLPNKLFEYVACGVPVISSAFPEMQRVVLSNDWGWVAADKPAAIAGLVRNITTEEIAQKHESIRLTRGRYGWQKEEETLMAVYASLFNGADPGYLLRRTRSVSDSRL